MAAHAEKAQAFLAMHGGQAPLLLPNAWDAGSAKLLVSLGFTAVATTSSGHAATLGRLDGSVTRDEAIAYAAAVVAAVDVPVSADLENCFAEDPAGVAETVRLAREAGLAGCSIEDFTGNSDAPIYDIDTATERVAAAVAEAHAGAVPLVLTARAENHLHGRPDLDDTIARLVRFQEAGADVLYAPGLATAEGIRQLVEAVELPVNVLARPGLPSVRALGEIGVRRVSVGGQFAFNALGAVLEAATEFREYGTYGFAQRASAGARAARSAFGS